MGLIQLIIVLIVVGFILWLINNYLPIDPKIKNIINVLIVICVVIWLLSIFLGYLPNVYIGPHHSLR